jgi:RNA polymerase sigma-70 factor (ECF subfamily)
MTFGNQVVACIETLRPRAVALSRNNYACQVDDLLQQTVLVALEVEHQFTPGTNLRAWMRTILRTVFLQHVQGRKFDRVLCKGGEVAADPRAIEDVACPVATATPEDVVYFREVCGVIGRLPVRQRDTVVRVMQGDKTQPGARAEALAAVRSCIPAAL